MELEEIKKLYDLESTHWWLLAKRALVLDEVRKTKRGMLLDVGCGTGSILRDSCAFHSTVGCELSRQALKLSRKLGIRKLVRSEAESLPFKDGSFDIVMALDVIEHIEDDERVIKEMHRVLRHGGKAIIGVPAHRFLWGEHDRMQHHRRRYLWQELKTKVERNGLKIRKMTYWNWMLFPLMMLYRHFAKGSDFNPTAKPFNSILRRLLRMENSLIRQGIVLPYGVSIFCVAEKA